VDIIGAHWIAVTAIILLGLALWRTLRPPARPSDTPSAPAEAPETAGVA
jgi:hypothetical protein